MKGGADGTGVTASIHDMTEEPLLLPLQTESPALPTANTSSDVIVDVSSAKDFWTQGHKVFFHLRIFDPTACSHRELMFKAADRRNKHTSRAHDERIQIMDHSSSLDDTR